MYDAERKAFPCEVDGALYGLSKSKNRPSGKYGGLYFTSLSIKILR
jgi:hypothetical protein